MGMAEKSHCRDTRVPATDSMLLVPRLNFSYPSVHCLQVTIDQAFSILSWYEMLYESTNWHERNAFTESKKHYSLTRHKMRILQLWKV